jgi:hypothetical protein
MGALFQDGLEPSVVNISLTLTTQSVVSLDSAVGIANDYGLYDRDVGVRVPEA